MVRFDVPRNHPKFGKLFPCSNLPLESELLNFTGLAPGERLYSWGKIIIENDDLLDAIKGIQDVLRRGYGMAYLWGGYGTAKTLLLKIAVAESLRADRSQWVQYTSMPVIVDRMRMTYDPKYVGESLTQIEKDYFQFPVLAIDEIGVERETEFSVEKQFMLIDARYTAGIERRENVVTLMASNLPPNELPGRTRSRILDGRCLVFEFKGEDFRLGAEWED